MKRVAILLLVLAFSFSVRAQLSKPYLVADFSEDEMGMMLDLCRQGGFEYLVHRSPFATFGHYEWNKDYFPKGSASVARMSQMAEQAGVYFGLLVQTDLVSTNDAFFDPKYFKQLRREGRVELFDKVTANDRDIALRGNEILQNPSSLNLILIEDELISYGTMEFAGDLVLLHHCTRGAYGTKKAAHKVSAVAYKLWDSPDRCVAPDGELLKTTQRLYAEKLDAAGVSFVIQKGDLGQEVLDETIRVRQVERWESDGVQNGSLGWFVIRATDQKKLGTSMEDLEWMLAKAACFDAGYGLLVDSKTIKEHGMLGMMLEKANQWRHLQESGAFSKPLKQMMRDPYLDWHLQQQGDTLCVLYPVNFSRRFPCNFTKEEGGVLTAERWQWNSELEGRFGLRIQVDGKTEVSNVMVNTEKGLVLFPCTIRPGQRLIYDFEDVAYVVDNKYNVLDEVTVEGISVLPEGSSEVYLICESDPNKSRPEVTVRYLTHERPETLDPYK